MQHYRGGRDDVGDALPMRRTLGMIAPPTAEGRRALSSPSASRREACGARAAAAVQQVAAPPLDAAPPAHRSHPANAPPPAETCRAPSDPGAPQRDAGGDGAAAAVRRDRGAGRDGEDPALPLRRSLPSLEPHGDAAGAAWEGESGAVIRRCIANAREQVPHQTGTIGPGGPPGISSWSMGAWLDSLSLSGPIAKHLERFVAGSHDDRLHLAFLRELAAAGDRDTVLELLSQGGTLLSALADLLWDELQKLLQAKAVSGEELNAKFSQDAKYTMAFGGLDTFFGGLEALIGSPDPRVDEAMRKDHCSRDDSDDTFTTDNYGITTTPRFEYAFVTAPDKGLGELGLAGWPREEKLAQGDPRCRRARMPAEVDELLAEINDDLAKMQAPGAGTGDQQGDDLAKMSKAELWGGMLYTGPMFAKYNAVNRGGALNGKQVDFMKSQFETSCKMNRYTTTIHVINSAILKLSKRTRKGRVYRGIHGGTLPETFWKANEHGVYGGVEFGFMSTTCDRDVAMSYASLESVAILLEIQMGMVDRGADLSTLSQYPHEKEICFAPLTGLEVLRTRVEGPVLVVEVRLNVNLNALTIEQVVQKRKKVVLEMCKNLEEEMGNHTAKLRGFEGFDRIATEVRSSSAKLFQKFATYPSNKFNDDQFLLRQIEMAVQIRQAPEFLLNLTHSEHGSCEAFEGIVRSQDLLGIRLKGALPSRAEELFRSWEREYDQHAVCRDMVARLRDKDCYIRGRACAELALLGEPGAEYADKVAERLFDKTRFVRAQALQALDAVSGMSLSLGNFAWVLDRHRNIDKICYGGPLAIIIFSDTITLCFAHILKKETANNEDADLALLSGEWFWVYWIAIMLVRTAALVYLIFSPQVGLPSYVGRWISLRTIKYSLSGLLSLCYDDELLLKIMCKVILPLLGGTSCPVATRLPKTWEIWDWCRMATEGIAMITLLLGFRGYAAFYLGPKRQRGAVRVAGLLAAGALRAADRLEVEGRQGRRMRERLERERLEREIDERAERSRDLASHPSPARWRIGIALSSFGRSAGHRVRRATRAFSRQSDATGAADPQEVEMATVTATRSLQGSALLAGPGHSA